MEIEDISSTWSAEFGLVEPVGFALRKALPDRWLRVHSLPGSKRYAETEAESRELLQRQNQVATAMLGFHQTCILFAAKFSDDREAPKDDHVCGIQLTNIESMSCQNEDEYEGWLHVFAACTEWRQNQFDALFLAVAEDAIGPISIANLQKKTVFAPYDGGADLFFASQESVQLSKAAWRSWLSDRQDGL
jgi:hypothetical protein